MTRTIAEDPQTLVKKKSMSGHSTGSVIYNSRST